MGNLEFKRIIFSDADGTIYEFPGHKLSSATKKSVLEAKKQGVEFVIVTGNPLYQKIKDLATELECRYVVCSNGAEIYDMKYQEYVFKNIIPEQDLEKVMAIVEANNGAISWNSETDFGLYNTSSKTREFYEFFNDFSNYNLTKSAIKRVFKLEVIEPVEKMKSIYKQIIEENVSAEVVLLDSHIEITAKGISKGNALKYLCEKIFKTSINNVMAIGDSENDLSMLAIAGYSYAMDNASQKIKSKVKLYAASVEQNGLGDAIVDYIYRTRLEFEKAEISAKIERQKAKLNR
ncbi:hypothetical protein MCAL160_0046 [Mycoplasmopsis californica HAZ160_1]|uniref:COF family HAD hydrolase protein n=1 Tax=Mycoplasmopsis californica HAZ160_1 TaxID=1397850 RepID=A0AAT9F7F1_9BACT|nr:hypothetical protein MCAL160_0046 [Mycoplasmopsis californica HAZ160_1]BBG40654.1 hypothetical protein MCAL106_0046 [Mycoplasmopsis californica]BBG41249.1 hypothetical protein MCAL106E_0046 [Mycoplasmopsis californica]BBG41842.1 hypothetical protein MCAL106L_0046 [Mycoplasmopsis californica]BBG42436.1 hypothetical protein MCAL160E_0046 [Mycoplasmopsis californica]